MAEVLVKCNFRYVDAADGLYVNADDLVKAFTELSVAVHQEDRLSPQMRNEFARGYRAAAGDQ